MIVIAGRPQQVVHAAINDRHPHCGAFLLNFGAYDIFGMGEAGHLIFGEQIDIDGY